MIHAYIALNTCATESIFITYYPLDLQLFNERIIEEELKKEASFFKRSFLQQSSTTQRNISKQYTSDSRVIPSEFTFINNINRRVTVIILLYIL